MADRVTTARRRVRVGLPDHHRRARSCRRSASPRAAAPTCRASSTSRRPRASWASGTTARRRGRRRSSSRCSLECGFAGKASSEDFGRPGSVRDTMHAKVLVVDDAVFVGSFNLSRSGEANAENVLEIEDAAIADRLAAWVDELRARYPPAAAALAGGDAAHERPGPAGPAHARRRRPARGGRRRRRSRRGSPRRAARWTSRCTTCASPARSATRSPTRSRAARARGVRVRIAIHDPEDPPAPPTTTPPQTRPDLLARDRRRRAADRRPRRPHAPQVRGARRRRAVVRLDELDARLVDARGERHRHRGLAAARAGLRAHLRGAVAAGATSRTRATSRRRRCASAAALVRPWFCPGRGRELAHRIATRIDRARHRVRIASPVLTSAPVLAALAEVAARGPGERDRRRRPHADRGRAAPVARPTSRSAGRRPCSRRCSRASSSTASARARTRPDTPHDFMHAKVSVDRRRGVRRLVQPLALGRGQRRERARDRRPRCSPTASPRGSTRCARATRPAR